MHGSVVTPARGDDGPVITNVPIPPGVTTLSANGRLMTTQGQ